jgi:hypothetical protein
MHSRRTPHKVAGLNPTTAEDRRRLPTVPDPMEGHRHTASQVLATCRLHHSRATPCQFPCGVSEMRVTTSHMLQIT